jgi:hypothetical protein
MMIYLKFVRISSYKINMPLNHTSKYPYLAVIVDNRASPLVVNAVMNVLQHIPVDWKVQIITSKQHWSFYNNSSLRPFIQSNRIFLTPLKQSSNSLFIGKDVNSILTSPSFWREVQGDKVLLFQIDSVLCSNSSSKITDFLEYDFIGAPWYIGGCCNGGLSIRNRIKILQMLESGAYNYRPHDINEDGWFTMYLPYFNGRIAPVSVAQRFSVETIYHPRPFGIHKPRINILGIENMTNLCNECPEVRSIVSYCQSGTIVNNSNKIA